jgi:hypothetical protein
MPRNALAFVLGSTLLASGCASVGNLTSIYRTPNLANGRSVVLDAEQWAVLNIPYAPETGSSVCAMPSPDALAAAAAAGSLNIEASEANTGSASGSGALGIGEAAASIGLRTQSIQLLRDAMYRMCEAYALGAIDRVQYGVMMRRFQANMIAILAIEQLTGAVAAPPVAVSATGEASIFRTLIAERQAIDDELTQVNQQLNSSTPEAEGGLTTDQRNRLTTRKRQLESDRNLYIQALGAIARGDFTAADVSVGAVSVRRGEYSNDAVAQAVEAITLATMSADNRTDFCFEVNRLRLIARDVTPAPGQPLPRGEIADAERDAVYSQYCEGVVDGEVQRRAASLSLSRDVIQALIEGNNLSRDELDAVLALLAQLDPNWSSGDLRDFSRARTTQGPEQ